MPSQGVVVSLPPNALPALREVARDEYRTPQAQAAWLVLEGLSCLYLNSERAADLSIGQVNALTVSDIGDRRFGAGNLRLRLLELVRAHPRHGRVGESQSFAGTTSDCSCTGWNRVKPVRQETGPRPAVRRLRPRRLRELGAGGRRRPACATRMLPKESCPRQGSV